MFAVLAGKEKTVLPLLEAGQFQGFTLYGMPEKRFSSQSIHRTVWHTTLFSTPSVRLLHVWTMCVSVSLRTGADYSIGEKSGYTPMHGAAYQGRATIAKLLIDFGVPFQGEAGMHEDG